MERMQNHSFLNSINYESRKHFERKFKSKMMTALLLGQLKIELSNLTLMKIQMWLQNNNKLLHRWGIEKALRRNLVLSLNHSLKFRNLKKASLLKKAKRMLDLMMREMMRLQESLKKRVNQTCIKLGKFWEKELMVKFILAFINQRICLLL